MKFVKWNTVRVYYLKDKDCMVIEDRDTNAQIMCKTVCAESAEMCCWTNSVVAVDIIKCLGVEPPDPKFNAISDRMRVECNIALYNSKKIPKDRFINTSTYCDDPYDMDWVKRYCIDISKEE